MKVMGLNFILITEIELKEKETSRPKDHIKARRGTRESWTSYH